MVGASPSFGFEQSKVLLFLSLTSLAGLIWLGRGFRWTLVNILSGIFVLSLLISSFLGIDPKSSILGRDPYFQGGILYLYLWLFSIMVAQAKIKLGTWAKVLTFSALVAGLLAIKDFVWINFFHTNVATYAGRVVSSFGQPNFYSGFLVLCLPLIHFIKFARFDILSKFLIQLIIVLAIFISGSKTAVAMVILQIYLLLVNTLPLSFKRFNWVLGWVIMVVAVVGSIYLSSGLFFDQYANTKLETWYLHYSPERREYIYPVVVDLIFKKPLLGYGLENLSPVFGTNLKPEVPGNFPTLALNDIKNLYVDRSHNYLLDLLIFGGALALISWLVLIMVLFKKAARNFLWVPLLIYLIWIQFQNQSVVHLIYFWLLVGLIDKLPEKALR